ncbi:hypothetical protein TYRP_022482 [Tyrophagus putrescentiae]|nr:hypothetical protein TYRP_022482 [Tyrophagus putrescentiae]
MRKAVVGRAACRSGDGPSGVVVVVGSSGFYHTTTTTTTTTTTANTTTVTGPFCRGFDRPPVDDEKQIAGDAHQTGESVREKDGKEVAAVQLPRIDHFRRIFNVDEVGGVSGGGGVVSHRVQESGRNAR